MRTVAQIGFVVALLASSLVQASGPVAERHELFPTANQLKSYWDQMAEKWLKEAEKQKRWAQKYGNLSDAEPNSARKQALQKMQQHFLAAEKASSELAKVAKNASMDAQAASEAAQPSPPLDSGTPTAPQR